MTTISYAIAFAGSATKILGRLVGNTIANAMRGKKTKSTRRLYSLHEQREFDYDPIPRVYGCAKIAGTVLWTSDVTENITIVEVGGQRKVDAQYTISLVIGLCEGPISSVENMWADEIQITDLKNIYIYKGTEEQGLDPYLETMLGEKNICGLKGMAYVVIRDFDITKFNNRIPNFTFEVIGRPVDRDALENLVESIVVIPGCGEFVYDTKIQYSMNNHGDIQAINQHCIPGTANSVISIKQMKSLLPKVQWVAPVVSWFGTSLDIRDCNVVPAVEHRIADRRCESWKVSDYDRSSAHLISRHNGAINYGGTPTDKSIIRYLEFLRSQNLRIMFYPMLLMDCEGKPWRGRLSGAPQEVSDFFRKKNGYKKFILHYAKLVKGKVDAFLIGSEMIGLTRIKDGQQYPAIDEFIQLAKEVKQILGSEVKISYAANWNEYHHDEYHNYHLDKLWMCDAIDFIGIDAYFPLTEATQSQHDVGALMNGWTSGEGYDFYWDGDRKRQLSPEYAWKNIEFWWSNKHFNPNGQPTEWIPKSKKIWFTEYGFASVSCTTNEPNVFVDDSTAESNLPKHSSGEVDMLLQRAAIQATELKWKNSEMVERKFLWTWDARPYPTWPAMKDVWSDGDGWQKGHWINGKVGVIDLRSIINDICNKIGLTSNDIETSELKGLVRGLVIDGRRSAKQIISDLQKIYSFDVSEVDGKLKFTSTYQKHNLEYSNILWNGREYPLKIEIKNDPQNKPNVSLEYLTPKFEIKKHDTGKGFKSVEIDLPIVLSEDEAKTISERISANERDENTIYEFSLPLEYMLSRKIKVNSLLELRYKSQTHLCRVASLNINDDDSVDLICTKFVERKQVQICMPSVDVSCDKDILVPVTQVEVFKIPGKNSISIAVSGISKKWHGCSINYHYYIGDTKTESHTKTIVKRSIIGQIESFSEHKKEHFTIDRSSQFVVRLNSGQIYSIPEDEMFITNNNLAMIGTEIVKFNSAVLQADGTYIISGLLRGLYGTKTGIYDRFVLLNDDVTEIAYLKGVDRVELEYKTCLDKLSVNLTASAKPISFKVEEQTLSPINLKKLGDYITWTPRVISDNLFEEQCNQYFIVKFSNDRSEQQRFTCETSAPVPPNLKDTDYTVSIAVFDGNKITSEFSSLNITRQTERASL